MTFPEQRCHICGKLIGIVFGDYPMDAFCQGHTQPEPVTYYYRLHDFSTLIAERDEARQWARKLYQRWQGTLDHLIEDNERWQSERTELRRQLEIATDALNHYACRDNWNIHNGYLDTDAKPTIRENDFGPQIADIAIAKMDGTSSYKAARGILPWKEGDEPAEESIRKLRGGGNP